MKNYINKELLRLDGVRLAFPRLSNAGKLHKGKYTANVLLKRESHHVENVERLVNATIAKSKLDVPADQMCLRDGNLYKENYSWFANYMSLAVSSLVPPPLLDKMGRLLDKDTKMFYSGCFANVQISMWVQNNRFGIRLLCNLHAVQFVKDGTYLGRDDYDYSKHLDSFKNA